jgi:serine/threonine-protein kinase HipA
MGRPSKTRRLDVWMNGEPVGQWTIAAAGRHEFRYATRWLTSPAVRPLSLSMPLRPAETPYRDSRVEAFFDNLLPDSHDIRRRLQARFGTASTNAFDLLAEIGRDCVGAIQLLPEGTEPQQLHCIEGTALDEAGVAAALRSAVASPALGQRDTRGFPPVTGRGPGKNRPAPAQRPMAPAARRDAHNPHLQAAVGPCRQHAGGSFGLRRE